MWYENKYKIVTFCNANFYHLKKKIFYFIVKMLARPFLADPAAKKKAKPYLEKALKHDKYYAPAVLHLSELLVEDGNTSRALDLLKKLAEVRPSAEIFMRIGEIYTLRKERMKSYEYFTLAVK